MRASRLLTILMTLQLQGRTTAQALADRLEVSRRTIYRDLDELSAAGVPIYADRGRAGGVALLDGFRTELTGLTIGETEALLLAGVPAAAADLGFAGEASAARIKLLAALPRDTATAARRVADRFHLDPLDWYRRPVTPDHLQTVSKCVWQDRRLEIHYQSWRRRGWTRIDPLGLVLKAGRWYLMARAGLKIRAYRLENLIEARPLDETFERPEPFDLASAWRISVQTFEAERLRLPAVLRAAPSAFDRLSHIDQAMAEALLTAPVEADGRRRAQVMIESIERAADLLIGFADEIEVVAPEDLREALRRRARTILQMYG
ncbi:helix-turn-helix transcriptional regulator [Brevundimonas faecalis]|uniref:DNA-binding transcriptional regulator YafY n=1 Tax=Brevundimonas faecalis TaxID=947378 RepID=A0ABV2RH18_9CAUL